MNKKNITKLQKASDEAWELKKTNPNIRTFFGEFNLKEAGDANYKFLQKMVYNHLLFFHNFGWCPKPIHFIITAIKGDVPERIGEAITPIKRKDALLFFVSFDLSSNAKSNNTIE